MKSQLGDLVDSEVWPGADAQTDEQLAQKVKNESWDHHPRGGAQIGSASNPDTVVDSDFKVLGTTGLRVIDASVLPDNIGSFIVSGLYQVGKLAGQKIADDAGQDPKPAQTANSLALAETAQPKTLEEAQAITKNAADAAEARGLISHTQHEALTDGTVSKLDMERSWELIDTLLASGEKKGGDEHTIAHNLLLSVAWQLHKQGSLDTFEETTKDRLLRLLGKQ